VTWMSWRLQRSLYLFFVVATAVVLGLTLSNGLHTASLLHQWKATPCHGGNGFNVRYQAYCHDLFNNYMHSRSADQFYALMAVVPLTLLGILLGANLVAGEIESTTVRVAWTQSITRRRWYASKAAVALASLTALSLPVCLTYTWWIATVDFAPRISSTTFAADGWMPLVIAVFAFALATLIGVVLRRPGRAIAATLLVMILVTWAIQNEVRPHLVAHHWASGVTTVVTKGDFTGANVSFSTPPNSWILFQGYVPTDWGHTVPTRGQTSRWNDELASCMSHGSSANDFTTCVQRLGLRNVQVYVADNEFWALQMREGAVYLAAAALLLGAGLVLVRGAKA